MSAPKTFKVGLITGSQRVPRVGPQIAAFILDTIQAHQTTTTSPTTLSITFDPIDIAALALPLFNEPGIPSQIHPPTTNYTHATTRAWSARVSACDAFVFVSPQYNWGIPAGLKNALDYLYHEWGSKPAVIVTYGGHGGDKCAAQLRVVLGGGLKMRVVEPVVCLSFGGREVVGRACRGEELGLKMVGWSKGEGGKEEGGEEEGEGLWADRRGEIVQAWEALVKALETGE